MCAAKLSSVLYTKSGAVSGSTCSRNSIPEPGGDGSTRNPIVALNGFVSACRISTASPVADRALDVDRRRLAESDVEAVVVCERGLDDLFLDLAVERDGQLLARIVLPNVDQRVLLGELRERDAKLLPRRRVLAARRPTPASAAGTHAGIARPASPIAVADLNLGEAPDLRDLAGRDRRALSVGSVVEDLDRRHLGFSVATELHAVACVDCAGEHARRTRSGRRRGRARS